MKYNSKSPILKYKWIDYNLLNRGDWSGLVSELQRILSSVILFAIEASPRSLPPLGLDTVRVSVGTDLVMMGTLYNVLKLSLSLLVNIAPQSNSH